MIRTRMTERLFEALKLGKKIPNSDVFLFKGSSYLRDSILTISRPFIQSWERRNHRHSRSFRFWVSHSPNAIVAVLVNLFDRKTTLLKCVAQLIILDEGKPFLWHKTPESWGFPAWRARVLYVPQRPRTSFHHNFLPLNFLADVDSEQ